MIDPTRTERLAAEAAGNREQRERRTAAAAAVRELSRTGSTATPAALTRLAERRLAERRHDGTTATLRDPGTSAATRGTNHADPITHASTPLETNREDH